MRKILFRGKSISNGEWEYGYLGERFNGQKDVMTISMANMFETKTGVLSWDVVEQTIGQFTGIGDKNGDCIFEGDIVSNNNSNVIGIVAYGDIYVPEKIEATHTGFFINWLSDTRNDWNVQLRSDLNYWIKQEEFKIIGNIHDNPELLESEVE